MVLYTLHHRCGNYIVKQSSSMDGFYTEFFANNVGLMQGGGSNFTDFFRIICQ